MKIAIYDVYLDQKLKVAYCIQRDNEYNWLVGYDAEWKIPFFLFAKIVIIKSLVYSQNLVEYLALKWQCEVNQLI